MRRLILAAALALAIPAAAKALDPGQQQEIVVAHNRWRAAVGVPALVWSEQLAALATALASQLQERNTCTPQHNPDNAKNRTGENLFWASPVRWSNGTSEVQAIAPGAVVDGWGDERRDYSFASNRCAPGRSCGHYTQVVWRESRELGCARAVCADGAQVWVCNYSPPGNVAGQRPY